MEGGSISVMTGGIIDMEEVLAGFGTALTDAAMTAMSGIHVFRNGFRVNPAEESPDIDETGESLTAQIAAVMAMIADEYDPEGTYSADTDFCIHDGKLYVCASDIDAAEEWTAAHWTETTVMEAVVALATAGT